jgi:hypothetical protein
MANCAKGSRGALASSVALNGRDVIGKEKTRMTVRIFGIWMPSAVGGVYICQNVAIEEFAPDQLNCNLLFGAALRSATR